MKAFFRERDNSIGPDDRKSSQQEFKDVLYESKTDTKNEDRVNNMLNTVVREVGLQNSIDNFKENKIPGKFILKVSLEKVNVNELLQIDYFATLHKELDYATNKLKAKTDRNDFDEKRIEEFSSVLESLDGDIQILKIEDNGGGLSGNGNAEDSDSDGTVAILSNSGGSKKSNSSGSYGKGGKTAHFTSSALTVFYESQRKRKTLSLGHTIISTWKDSGNVRRGGNLYAVCPLMDTANLATPIWNQGPAPSPLNRTLTIKGEAVDGLTTCCVAPVIYDGWEYQVIYAIVTSHLHALQDAEFDYELRIGQKLITRHNLYNEFCEVQHQDFFYNSNDSFKIHYYMSLAKLKKEINTEKLTLDLKLKDKTIHTHEITLEWGKSEKIEKLCVANMGARSRDDLRNHFLLVNKGMILRTGLIFKSSGGSYDWLKVKDFRSGYFGYVIVDESLGKYLRVCERPSHDSIQPSKLDERTQRADIPTSRAFNKLLYSLERDITSFISDLEKVDGATTSLKLFSFKGEDEDEQKDTPNKTLILIDSPAKKARERVEYTTLPVEGDDVIGEGHQTRVNPNPHPIPRPQGVGMTAHKQYCTVTKNDPLTCSMKIIIDPVSKIEAGTITVYQIIENEGKLEPIDSLNDFMGVTIAGNRIPTKPIRQLIGGKSINCHSLTIDKDIDQITIIDIDLSKNIPAITPILKLEL